MRNSFSFVFFELENMWSKSCIDIKWVMSYRLLFEFWDKEALRMRIFVRDYMFFRFLLKKKLIFYDLEEYSLFLSIVVEWEV